MEKKKYADHLKKLIQDKGLTYRELSEMTGIPQNNISHYANGIREPNIELIGKIADALDTPVQYFFGQPTIEVTKVHTDIPDIKIYYGETPPEVAEDFTVAKLFETMPAASPEPDLLDYASDRTKGYVIIRNDRRFKELHAFQITGDSMQTALYDKDYIIVNKKPIEPTSLNFDKIYLVRLNGTAGGGLALKRLKLSPCGRYLILFSDNVAYPPRTIDLSTVENPIMGVIVQSWREW